MTELKFSNTGELPETLDLEGIRKMSWMVKVQPMQDWSFIFYGSLLESKMGYWHYNGKRFTDLDDVAREYLNSQSNIIK